MTIDTFKNKLRSEYGYQTSLHRSSFPIWGLLIYYIRLIWIILIDNIFILFGKYDRDRWMTSSYFALKSVEAAGGTVNISGLNHTAAHQGTLIFAANHMSMLDALILPCLTLPFGKVTFVVKDQLLSYPLFGNIMKAVHPISILRKNPREDLKLVLEKGQEMITKGYSIVIFPQSTRSEVFDAASFNSLSVKLSKKTGVPVVPVALKTDFQKNGRFIKEIGGIDPRKTVYVRFGIPMTVTNSGRSTQREIVRFIEESLKSWGAAVKHYQNY